MKSLAINTKEMENLEEEYKRLHPEHEGYIGQNVLNGFYEQKQKEKSKNTFHGCLMTIGILLLFIGLFYAIAQGGCSGTNYHYQNEDPRGR